jgi:spore coat protein CotH
MSKSKYIDRICTAIIATALIITLLFVCIGPQFIKKTSADPAYAKRLFDNDRVHTLDIVVKDKDWQDMLENALDKQYIPCNVVIDGESVKNVAIRPKGASSLFSVSQSSSDRFSFKVEFDHYEPSKTYYGLDKMALNNLIQDNTYLMDHLAYDMMRKMGVNSPLTSFIWITVNGSDFGLYLAVEGIEDAFAKRNYGNERGNIYKPDSENLLGMGGEENLAPQDNIKTPESQDKPADTALNKGTPGNAGDNTSPPEMMADDIETDNKAEQIDGTIGADDVSLLYSDDNPENYINIFDNSVFDNVSKADKKRLIQSLKKLNEQKDLSEALDIKEVIQYFAVHNFLINGDSYTGTLVHNYYLREYNGKLSMLPWDYNLSFGGMLMNFAQVGNDATSYINAPIDSPVSGGDAVMQSRPMISWIFSDENYKEMYHQAVSDFIAEYFESGYFDEMFQKNMELLSSYVKNDPSAFAGYEEFLNGTQTLKAFCQLRVKSIRGQLNGTIPATIEGQEASPATLIDGSSIDLNAMTKDGDIGAAGSVTESANHSSAPAANSQPPAGETTGETGGDIVMPLPEEGSAEIGADTPDGKTQSTAGQSEEEAERLNNLCPAGRGLFCHLSSKR